MAEQNRLAGMLNDFVDAHKRDGTTPSTWDMISLLSGAVIDLEEQVVELQRRVDEK